MLLDANIELKASDHAVMDLLDRAAVTYQLVLTKSDGVKPPKLVRKRTEVEAAAAKHPAAFPEILVTSASKSTGIDILRAALATLANPLPSAADYAPDETP